jgi:Cu-Zn family superoxide dismutase
MASKSTIACSAALAALCLAAPGPAKAAETTVTVHALSATGNGLGRVLGRIKFSDSPEGLVIEPNLKGLPPGPHGFHVHENPSCAPGQQGGNAVAGLGAGGHYDPDKTGKHVGPGRPGGHKGDLPVLVVDADGSTKEKGLTAPRLKVADLRGRSLIIHAGADNYADTPAPLGGGGARIACGLFRK